MSRLLAADALRSDDPDLGQPTANDDLDLEAAAAAAAAASPNPNLQTAAHPAATANMQSRLAMTTVEAAAWDQPPKGSDALLQVNVRLNVYKVSMVDSRAGTFFVKIGAFCYWTDPRLIGWQGKLPPDLWGPRFRVTNSTPDLTETNVEFAIVDESTGRLKRCRIYEGIVESPLTDMASFPFDTNTFRVQFCTISDYATLDDSVKSTVPLGKSYEVREVGDSSGEGNWLAILWDGSILEWKLHGVSTQFEVQPKHPAAGYEQTYLFVNMHMSRRSNFFVWKVLMPQFSIIVLALTAFGFDLTDVPSRAGLVSTYFLASFAMLFVIGDSIPKLDFLTCIDTLVAASSGLLLVIGLAALPISWVANFNPELAGQVNAALACACAFALFATYGFVFAPPVLRKRRIIEHLNMLDGGDQLKGTEAAPPITQQQFPRISRAAPTPDATKVEGKIFGPAEGTGLGIRYQCQKKG